MDTSSKPKDAPYLVFGAPLLEEVEIQEVVAVLRSGWLGTGPRVAQFERDFAAYKTVDAGTVVAVNSCTAALHISMIAAGMDAGAEVITTPLTFCATVNAIVHAGMTPVLADIDATTQCLDPKAIEAAITPRTQAILLVHFAGRPCNMDAIMSIANRHKLLVIEDCAHAIETEYRGVKAGSFGDFGCFSFYATKNVVTGEGGMIIARDQNQAARAKILALHGMSKDAWHRFSDKGYKHYEVIECGFKYNMMDLQAALGIHQLARVDDNWSRRQTIWNHYQSALSDLPIALPSAPEEGTRHAYHLYTVGVDSSTTGLDRDSFVERLHAKGIGTGVHYLSIPEHPFYQDRFDWTPEAFPNAMRTGRQTLSLPLSAKLSSSDVDRIIESVRAVVAES